VTDQYTPAHLVPPGHTLLDWLERADMTQAEFAKRTGLTAKHINQVAKGGAGISPEVAMAFELVTDIVARYWLQLEVNFQAARQRVHEEQELSAHSSLVRLFPYKALQKRGFIKAVSGETGQLRELLRFFGVASPAALSDVSLQPLMFRLAGTFEADDAALAAWVRIAELEATGAETKPFDANACREALEEMRNLSALPGLDWLKPLQHLTASVGIALVIVEELPGARVNGATRWLSTDKAMVALSFRHKRNDIFWFTLFHEMCHLLRHSKKQTFVHTNNDNIAEELEHEADAFAARVLIPPHAASELAGLTSESDVVQFAKKLGVAPGIVVGRMQHARLIPHNQWTRLFDRYKFVSAP
jgi:HTH-type transcriptional regulator / antitoxin HigA